MIRIGRSKGIMRKILIVIDMQNDFIDGALGTEEAVAVVEPVKEKIRSYPPEDVIATMDTHGTDYMDTQEGRNLPVPHCIKGSDGWRIRPDIAELLGGAKIYEQFLLFCRNVYVTKVDAEFEADRFFRNMDDCSRFYLADKSETQEENGIQYQFLHYRKEPPEGGRR